MGSTSLMIRKPALEVLHHLKAISQDTHPPPKFIFCILYSNLHLHLKYASLLILQCACCHSFASQILSLTQFLPKNKPSTLQCTFKSLARFPILQSTLVIAHALRLRIMTYQWKSKIARVYFCQASVINFCWWLSCHQYYWSVRNSETPKSSL